jgi:cell division protein FtsB
MNKKSPPRGSRIALALIVAATVCLCVAVLVPGVRHLHEAERQKRTTLQEKKKAEDDILRLQREKEDLETDEGIERVARDDLHYAKPGETIFVFEKTPEAAGEGEAGAAAEPEPTAPVERRP